MKSSAPVFTKKNSFPPASTVKKTHYHSSCNQSLSKKEKKTALSPVHSNQQSTSRLNSLRSDSHRLHKKHDHLDSSIDGRSPVSNTARPNMGAPKHSAKQGKSSESLEPEVHRQHSVLARYVERFRHGHPQSPEDRQQMASATAEEQESFWWLSPSSLPSCSTPTEATYKDIFPPLEDDYEPAIFSPAGQPQLDRSLSPSRQPLFALSDTSQGELDESEIEMLQERARKLLLRGECDLNEGSNPVSSEGLGTSDFSSPVTVDEPVRRPVLPSLIMPVTAKARPDSINAGFLQISANPSLVRPTRPEEDILFQWRLRRKMEQARDSVQNSHSSTYYGTIFNQLAPTSFHSSASGQAYKQPQSTQPLHFSPRDPHPPVSAPQPNTHEDHRMHPSVPGPAPLPAFAVSGSPQPTQSYAVAHVPAHMHLLCDVLPCPMESSQTGQSVSQRFDAPESTSAHRKTEVIQNSVNTFSNAPDGKGIAFPPAASSGAVEDEGPSHRTVPDRDKKKKSETKEPKNPAMSNTKQKKAVRNSSRQKLPKKVTPLNQPRRQEGSREIPRKSIPDEHDPPPSPLRRALGQVVSEVLFTEEDPAPAQKLPVDSRSPSCIDTAPAQSSVPPRDAQKSLEIISQLLQEAEDSDEKDFEDDCLLRVLRKQRKWVKEQISEVNFMLKEVLEEEQVT